MCNRSECNLCCEPTLSNFPPPFTQIVPHTYASKVNNATCVQSHILDCTDQRHLITVCFQNSMSTWLCLLCNNTWTAHELVLGDVFVCWLAKAHLPIRGWWDISDAFFVLPCWLMQRFLLTFLFKDQTDMSHGQGIRLWVVLVIWWILLCPVQLSQLTVYKICLSLLHMVV